MDSERGFVRVVFAVVMRWLVTASENSRYFNVSKITVTTFGVLLSAFAQAYVTVPSSDPDGQFTMTVANPAIPGTGIYTEVEVQRRTGTSGTWTNIGTYKPGKYSQSLNAGTYQYRGRGKGYYYGPALTSYGAVDTITITVPKPAKPSSLTRSEHPSYDGTYSINWGSASRATRYEWRENSGGWKSSGTSRSKSFSKSDGRYSYQVRACNAAGCSAATSAVTVDVVKRPGVPSSIGGAPSSVDVSNASFTVSWGAASGNVDRYELDQRKGTGSWSRVYSGTARSKAITLSSAGDYRFRVRAVNTFSSHTAYGSYRTSGVSGVEPNSNVTVTVPSTDPDGTFTMTLSNPAVPNAGIYTDVEVQRRLGTSGSWSTIGTFKPGTHTQQVGEGTYYYRARGKGNYYGVAYTAYGPVDSIKIIPPIPGAISSISRSEHPSRDGNYTISWGKASSATRYEWRENNGSWKNNGTTRNKTISGKSDGVYTYQVRGCNSTGCGTFKTIALDVVRPPGVPSSISGVPASVDVSNASFTVSWGTASGSVDRYELYQQKGTGSWSNVYSGTGRSKAISLTSSGSYKFRVRAVNTFKGHSATGGYRTSGTATIEPNSSVTVTIPSRDYDGRFNMTLSDPAIPNAGIYTHVEVQRKLGSGSWVNVGTFSPGTHGQVIPLGNYSYRARGKGNYYGEAYTAYGPTVTITVAPPVPAVPTSLTRSEHPSKDGTYSISWPAVEWASRYEWQEGSGSWVNNNASRSKGFTKTASDTTYSYKVRACNSTGCSSPSAAISVDVALAPKSPGYLNGAPSVVDSDASFTLNWNAAPGAVDFYQLYSKKDNGGWTKVYEGNNRSAPVTINGLGQYRYRVRGVNTYKEHTVYGDYRLSGTVLSASEVKKSYAYDALGRLIQVDINGEEKSTYEYDDAGNRKNVKDRE